MKPWLIWLLVLASLAANPPTALAADADEEQKLIAVLQSATAGPAEKDAACAHLKLVGTRRCVPALSALLTNDQLSHSARYALEPMPFDEAGTALRDALTNTTGLLRVGIINSLATRNDIRAVAALAQLLHDADADTQKAAAFALGQIGGTEALTALRNSAHDTTPLHPAIVDALLRCANRMLNTGQRSMALAVFEQLDTPNENETIRAAAFAGRVRASGNAGLNMVLHAIGNPTEPGHVAALQLARELPVPNTTRELGRLLPDLKPPVQGALLQALAQRGDVTVVPAVVALVKTAPSESWPAIIELFDALGDASVVPFLAGWAASTAPDIQKPARHALVDLHRGNVTQALIDQLSTATPAAQAELARALGSRGDKAAVPKLVELAKTGPAQHGVFQALSLLVDSSQLATLTDLVLQAKDQAVRTEAAESLNAAYLRLQSRQGRADVTPLVQAIEKGSAESRIALLPICSSLADPAVAAVVRSSMTDPNLAVQRTAVRTLCDTVDADLLPNLLQLARSTKEDSVRSMSISGAVRLTTQEDTVKLTAMERVNTLKQLMACASSPEQKRKVLAGLGEVPDPGSLAAVEAKLHDSSVCNEAARATVKIATALPSSETVACEAALKKALASCNEDGTRIAVVNALKQIQDNADYLTNWEVAGPYKQANKDYAALFDTGFPPETQDSKDVKWQRLPAGSDPKRPWVMDLLKALGGQQCVAYARTWVHCDQAQGAVLELGSDDGMKVWLNHKQIYALNVARPLQPGSDKITVSLHEGWNPLLLKITQNNQGWEFCVRIRNADGAHLAGVRCDSAPNLASAKP